MSGNQLTVVSADVFAKEDSKGGNIDVTLGSGSAGAGVLAASVITLRRHHNNKSISAETPSLPIRTLTFSIHSKVRPTLRRQTSLALASGTAAYADAEITGGASTIWEGNVSGGIKLEEPKPDGSKDEANKAEENKHKRPIPYLRLRRKINQKSI